MNKRDILLEVIDENDDLMFADGFDEAILGISHNGCSVIYSYSKAVEILCENMTQEDAFEFLDFNTLSVTGKFMPIWVMDEMF
jgi:hypothetical protein